MGLAGNQIGMLRRVFVFQRGRGRGGRARQPAASSSARTRPRRRRGGLPVDAAGSACRSSGRVTVDRRGARTRRGRDVRLELEGLTARVAQHEMDHLDGDADPRPHRRREPAARRSAILRPQPVLRVVARLAVAATAPFGADVLERLAAHHEIAYLLTRPDAAARPRPQVARLRPRKSPSGSGSRCASRSRLAGFEPDADAVVVVAYGALVPSRAARPGALAERPSVAAAALARRRAGRAGDHRRRPGDRRDDPRDDRPSSTPARSRRRRRSRSRPRTTRARSTRGLGRGGGAADRRRAADAELRAAARGRRTYAEKIAADRPRDRLVDPRRTLVDRVRALSPHIGARAELEGRPRDRLARAGRGRPRRPGRGAARGQAAHDRTTRSCAASDDLVVRRGRGEARASEPDEPREDPPAGRAARARAGLARARHRVGQGRPGAILLAREFGCRITCVERAPEFTAVARERREPRRADRGGRGGREGFPDRAGHYDAALCLGASFACGGLVETLEALEAGQPRGSSPSASRTGARGRCPRELRAGEGEDFLPLAETVGRLRVAPACGSSR